ncbi:hypothetical protein DXG01_000776 [Tephrocybe rancida]|nr:hypothetical protein DXG01_000776 [Tephrocybe rancida]
MNVPPAADVANINGKSVLSYCFVGGDSSFTLQRRYLPFLLKAVYRARSWIDQWKAEHSSGHDAVKHWREYLGGPRDRNRVAFYTRVINGSPLEGFEEILDDYNYSRMTDNRFKGSQMNIYNFRSSQCLTQSIALALTEDVASELDADGPFIIFYFDAAHNLTTGRAAVDVNGGSQQTAYYHLCKALTYWLRHRLLRCSFRLIRGCGSAFPAVATSGRIAVPMFSAAPKFEVDGVLSDKMPDLIVAILVSWIQPGCGGIGKDD